MPILMPNPTQLATRVKEILDAVGTLGTVVDDPAFQEDPIDYFLLVAPKGVVIEADNDRPERFNRDLVVNGTILVHVFRAYEDGVSKDEFGAMTHAARLAIFEKPSLGYDATDPDFPTVVIKHKELGAPSGYPRRQRDTEMVHHSEMELNYYERGCA